MDVNGGSLRSWTNYLSLFWNSSWAGNLGQSCLIVPAKLGKFAEFAKFYQN